MSAGKASLEAISSLLSSRMPLDWRDFAALRCQRTLYIPSAIDPHWHQVMNHLLESVQGIEPLLPEDPLALQYSVKKGLDCARHTWSTNHLLVAFFVLFLGLYLLSMGWKVLGVTALACLSAMLVTTIVVKLCLILVSLIWNTQTIVTRQEVLDLANHSLPIYTILVPLFREAKVAEGIVNALGRLDYPRERLDIKLLLEGDDQITIDAVSRLSLGQEYDVILVAPSLPRTKPKACNYGLAAAKGDFTVIFDAEDRPEPDQLLKSVSAFSIVESNVMCLQAQLNYYNPRDNFLTKSFALEYTMWFDLYLPGIQLLNGPIPLGGTSNHFRTSVLKELGGWDPYNVTEDCDLGIRLAISGYRTKLLDSTTWEEANSKLGNWMRQRSRWMKGYLQTYFVHTKRPFNLLRKLGVWKTMLYYCCVASVPVQQMINLVCWPITIATLWLQVSLWFSGTVHNASEQQIDGISLLTVVGYATSTTMFSANFLFILIALCACLKRGYGDLALTALLSPIYWLIAAIATWKGAIQLLYRPHFWEKTNHGLTSAVFHLDDSDLPLSKGATNESSF